MPLGRSLPFEKDISVPCSRKGEGNYTNHCNDNFINRKTFRQQLGEGEAVLSWGPSIKATSKAGQLLMIESSEVPEYCRHRCHCCQVARDVKAVSSLLWQFPHTKQSLHQCWPLNTPASAFEGVAYAPGTVLPGQILFIQKMQFIQFGAQDLGWESSRGGLRLLGDPPNWPCLKPCQQAMISTSSHSSIRTKQKNNDARNSLVERGPLVISH